MDPVSLSFKAISAIGGSLGTEIAKRLSNGMNIDALKSKEDKVIDELKNLQKSIESSKTTTLNAIRMQKVIDADNRVSGFMAELEKAVKVQDVEEFTTWVRRINSLDGVSNRLTDMNTTLMKDQGNDAKALLPPLADRHWEKLLDPKSFNYGVQEYEAERKAALAYPILIERLGLSLILLETMFRPNLNLDPIQKDKNMAGAISESDKRVQAWNNLWDDKKKSYPAYELLWSEVQRQTGPAPASQGAFIRAIAAVTESSMPPAAEGDILDGQYFGGMGGWQNCYQKPPSYAKKSVEWQFSLEKTGLWSITNPTYAFLAKLIPVSTSESGPLHLRAVCQPAGMEPVMIERTFTLVTLPLSLASTKQQEMLESWRSGAARSFLARVDNCSPYTLIPCRYDGAYLAAGTDLYGVSNAFESPVLPGGTTYVAGRNNKGLSGSTSLFEFTIWSTPPAITDSSIESEKRFQELKCFQRPPRQMTKTRLAYHPGSGAEYLGTLVLMVSISYWGDTKGAIFASDYWPGEIVQLKEEDWFTGGYNEHENNSKTMKVLDVEWDIQQGDHLSPSGTGFKIFKKKG